MKIKRKLNGKNSHFLELFPCGGRGLRLTLSGMDRTGEFLKLKKHHAPELRNNILSFIKLLAINSRGQGKGGRRVATHRF